MLKHAAHGAENATKVMKLIDLCLLFQKSKSIETTKAALINQLETSNMVTLEQFSFRTPWNLAQDAL